ncbi:hypothetical protein D3OALGB2SA_4271 [Olavius algarvensis associated proteobacterium Delta 3]|nr:hypothetical protein D3OALGB2SA_4271 [Olavius algarvensis associated proteobacterium Delta 3]
MARKNRPEIKYFLHYKFYLTLFLSFRIEVCRPGSIHGT